MWCEFLNNVDIDVCDVIQADNHQENLVIAEAKKLEADGLVNFITINEVRYITEYNQVVGPTHVVITIIYEMF